MNTTRIATFIDGAYLDATARNECGGVKIDYAKLAQKLAGGVEILRTYYYNCLPYQRNPPTAEESLRFSQAQKFHAALRSLPRFEVREGMLVYRGSDERRRFPSTSLPTPSGRGLRRARLRPGQPVPA